MESIVLKVINICSKGYFVSLIIMIPFLKQIIPMSLIDVGYLTGVLPLSAIISAYLSSVVTSKLGVRLSLIVVLLLFVIFWVTLIFNTSLLGLYFVFALCGFSTGMFDPIGSAIVVKNSDPKKLAQNVGDFAAVGDLGRILFTAITAWLVSLVGISTTSIVFALFSLTIIFTYYVISKSRNINIDEKPHSHYSPIHLVRNKLFLLALITAICDSFSSSSIFIFIPFLLEMKGLGINYSGFFVTLFFVGYLVGRMGLGRLSDKLGKTKTLVAAEIAMALFIYLLIYSNNFFVMVLALFSLGVFTRGTSPIIKSMSVEPLKKDEVHSGLGLYSSVSRTSNSLSRPVYASFGYYFGITSIFYLSSFVAILTLLPAVLYMKRKVL